MAHIMLRNDMWQILAALGVALVIGELLVNGFVLLPIGIAFLITAAFSVVITNWAVLLAFLALSEVAVFLMFRKYLRKFRGRTNVYTNAEGMVGQECIVVEPISAGEGGYVKLYGDLWSARSYSHEKMKKGDRVVITKTDGNKVIVEPINELED